MKVVDNLKTAVKLIVAFTIITLVTAGVAILGITYLQSLNAALDRMYSDQTVPIEQLGIASSGVFQVRGDVFKYILIPEEREAIGE